MNALELVRTGHRRSKKYNAACFFNDFATTKVAASKTHVIML